MSSNQPGGASGIPAHVVPLPPTPNLEFERKRAKKMLREIREGDRDALARVRIFREGINRSDVKLADVHLMIAREYGFSSWPKLVAYHETWERHAEPGPRVRYDRRDYYDARVQNIIRSHAGRTAFSSQLLATFVPRFYARSDAEIFASQITEAEAQLAVARMERFPNWDALIERASREMPPDERPADPKAHTRLYREKTYGLQFTEALEAIDRHDAAALSDLLDKNPEMISVEAEGGQDGVRKQLLIYSALHKEKENRDSAPRAVTDLLIARGADVVTAATAMLLIGIYVKADDISYLLDRGADPHRMPLPGVPLLDWAIMRYWNPDAVDLIAARVKQRSAFWIAAGLGDVRSVLEFIDNDGKPTEAARRDRPDLILAGLGTPCRPEADDLEIMWEAFMVAGFNRRLEVIDALLDRGFPVDYNRWGSTLLQWAHGNRHTVLADHLARRGARS